MILYIYKMLIVGETDCIEELNLITYRISYGKTFCETNIGAELFLDEFTYHMMYKSKTLCLSW